LPAATRLHASVALHLLSVHCIKWHWTRP